MRVMDRETVRLLVDRFGQRYSDLLGIRVEGGESGEVFKWFLVSVLFGAPISEAAVIKTYRCFEGRGVVTPRRIVETGWDGLVEILDEGSYTRYDFKTADKLLAVMGSLMANYRGDLNLLHGQSRDSRDLEERLKALGKGVGDVTVGIFLRELRGVWAKADPRPTPLVVLAAKNLGIVESEEPAKAQEGLKAFWRESGVPGKAFVNLETALLRVGKDLCRRMRCGQCPLRPGCPAATSSSA